MTAVGKNWQRSLTNSNRKFNGTYILLLANLNGTFWQYQKTPLSAHGVNKCLQYRLAIFLRFWGERRQSRPRRKNNIRCAGHTVHTKTRRLFASARSGFWGYQHNSVRTKEKIEMLKSWWAIHANSVTLKGESNRVDYKDLFIWRFYIMIQCNNLAWLNVQKDTSSFLSSKHGLPYNLRRT